MTNLSANTPMMFEEGEPFSRRLSEASSPLKSLGNSADARAKNFIMKIVERKNTIKTNVKPSQDSYYRKSYDQVSSIKGSTGAISEFKATSPSKEPQLRIETSPGKTMF